MVIRHAFVRGVATLATSVAASLALLSGCSALLGGLDEGRSAATDAGRDPADVEAEDSRPAADVACRGRLEGFAYRAPIHVAFDGLPVTAFQVPITLDTAALVAAGKMRADGADIRLTQADGVTPVPHWIERDINSAATRLWIRLDLRGDADAWLYYGAANAADTSSLVDTFVPAVVDDPFFQTSTAWLTRDPNLDRAAPTSRTNEWSVTLANGKATVRMTRKGTPNSATGGLCQPLLLPPGSMHRFVVDIDVALADRANALVWSPSYDWPLYQGNNPTASTTLETDPIAPGRLTVCFGVSLHPGDLGQAGEMSFSRPRVRRVVNAEPSATVGAEEEGCP